ncbi:MAG: hypothetical protein ACI8XC_004508 [Gammaproteobacteria bacterium]|jgi:hypothetical protein
MVRRHFVDVDFLDFAPNGKKQTVSNVAIITGLKRSVRVIGGWVNDKAYLGIDGNPKDLGYEGTGSFSELVRQYSGDMPVVARQKALQKSGNISLL